MVKLFNLSWFCPVFSPAQGEGTINKMHPQVNGKEKEKQDRDLRSKWQEFYTSEINDF